MSSACDVFKFSFSNRITTLVMVTLHTHVQGTCHTEVKSDARFFVGIMDRETFAHSAKFFEQKKSEEPNAAVFVLSYEIKERPHSDKLRRTAIV
jgi:hypothetical protein